MITDLCGGGARFACAKPTRSRSLMRACARGGAAQACMCVDAAAPFGKLPYAAGHRASAAREHNDGRKGLRSPGGQRERERGRASGVHDGFCYDEGKASGERERAHRFFFRPSLMRRSTCELHFLTRARPKLCGGRALLISLSISLSQPMYCTYSAITANLLGGGGGSGTIGFCAKVARTSCGLKLYVNFAQVPPRDTETPERRRGGSA